MDSVKKEKTKVNINKTGEKNNKNKKRKKTQKKTHKKSAKILEICRIKDIKDQIIGWKIWFTVEKKLSTVNSV